LHDDHHVPDLVDPGRRPIRQRLTRHRPTRPRSAARRFPPRRTRVVWMPQNLRRDQHKPHQRKSGQHEETSPQSPRTLATTLENTMCNRRAPTVAWASVPGPLKPRLVAVTSAAGRRPASFGSTGGRSRPRIRPSVRCLRWRSGSHRGRSARNRCRSGR